MQVCFSVGPMSERLISSISKSADNVKFSSYGNLGDMIRESTMRHIFFDRIVFSEKILSDSESELKALNSYISEYSDNTKIVFICQSGGSKNIELFNSIFNSPLYTVVLVGKVTTNVLLEFIKGDITELKAKYYSLDVKEVKAVTSKYAGGGIEKKDDAPVVKKEKKGFFKSLFGGKKNNAPKNKNQKSDIDSVSTLENAGMLPSKNSYDDLTESSSPVDMIGSNVGSVGNGIKNDIEEKRNFNDSVPVYSGTSFNGNENDDFSLDDDFLGIGELGEQHCDTGFLDDDAESEIENALKELDYSEVGIDSNKSLNMVKPPYVADKNKKLDCRIVIGERGIGVTSYITEYAVAQAGKGKKVLIVDLDFLYSGVLSYIDTDAFYGSGSSCGIDRLVVYSEDGVDIISNGLGGDISSDSLSSLVSSGLFYGYDIVFIDCPLDCISVLNSDIVDISRVMVKVRGNRGSLLALLSTVSSRGYISASLEDLLFERCRFEVIDKLEYYDEDITYLRDTCLFGRVDWLSKVG